MRKTFYFTLISLLHTISLWAPKTAFAQGGEIGINISPPTQFQITKIGPLISASFGFLLIIAGIVAFFFLIMGGIQWITSGGDKAGIEAARNKIIHAVVGLIIVFSTWAITILLQNFLGVTIIGEVTIPKPF